MYERQKLWKEHITRWQYLRIKFTFAWFVIRGNF